MYKDPQKQKEANKAAKQRYRLKQAKKNAPALRRTDELKAEGITAGGITQKVSREQGITAIGLTKDGSNGGTILDLVAGVTLCQDSQFRAFPKAHAAAKRFTGELTKQRQTSQRGFRD